MYGQAVRGEKGVSSKPLARRTLRVKVMSA
jgi:hypothetical protein